jgi:5-methylcytosine-specific restriction endonuclease McrBC regulatory subunit McrC
VGAQLKVGRKRETVHPIRWDPPYLGSQKSLVPDIVLERGDLTVIIDAKYKRHWEELHQHSWSKTEEQFREEHRNDLLQVLAYANLARTSRVIVCLVYPCSPERWTSLQERGRFVHKADLAIGSRSLHLWLTAVPMAMALEPVASRVADELRPALQNI